MDIVRWIVNWIAKALWVWANPDEAAKVDQFLADEKAADAQAVETQKTIATEQSKVDALSQTEQAAAARQQTSEAAANQTDKELHDALTPKPTPARSDDDELRRLSDRL